MNRLLAILISCLAVACTTESGDVPDQPKPAPPTAQQEPVGPSVLVLGDSLAAGYGLPKDEAFPALVEELLRDEGIPVRIQNGGVSGDTTAGGLQRLDWILRSSPDIVVVELGANDGLRGLPLDRTEENLRALVEGARAKGARVLLCGMLVPPNYGPDYAEGFAAIFPRVAQEMDVPFLPFLIEDTAGREEFNLDDGIHPNREGHELVARTVLPHLRELVLEFSKP